MKTAKHLYPQIIAFENLYQAFRKAARGKRAKNDVADFEYDLEANLLRLRQELGEKSYVPGGYYNFRIHDPKPRLISAAPFRDRVVHHALCRVIEPIFERRFICDSYACRVGKGTHRALHRAQQFARKYPYVLKLDIEHFFPSIDHQVLYQQLARVIADGDTLWLCQQILRSGATIHRQETLPLFFPGDDLFTALRAHGLPIGNLTSQFWANVVLNPLDHFIKRQLKCAGYLRYVDDLLLFAPEKPLLHAWRKSIFHFGQTLRLRFHENQSAVFPVETGIPFLGWRIYPDHLRLKRRNGVAFQRRLKRLSAAYGARQIKLEHLHASIQGWVAHVSHGQTWGLRRALLSQNILPNPQEASIGAISHLQQDV